MKQGVVGAIPQKVWVMFCETRYDKHAPAALQKLYRLFGFELSKLSLRAYI